MDNSYYRTPDLIVSDFRLKGPTALEFVRWLKQSQFARVPVVILSGALRGPDMPPLSEAGVKDFIYKDPDVMTLADRLRPLLPILYMGLCTGSILGCAA
jgi:CheY-like chemotaxis protein